MTDTSCRPTHPTDPAAQGPDGLDAIRWRRPGGSLHTARLGPGLLHERLPANPAGGTGQQGWPLLVALAGLPSLPRELSEAKSYAERLFSYHRIEHLTGPSLRMP